ncbi:DNA repair protein rad51c [Coemansia sp. BCRC 34301]|nr:DNA repair protein rad51c [Coemansia sp. BCRC 34301]
MSRSVLSLRLPAYLQTKLIRNGYHTIADLDESSLAEDLSQFLSQSEARSLALVAKAQPSAHSAWSLRQQALTQRYFSTQLCQLDALLGGSGIRLGCITEITGEPGSGQTDLCLRLCLAARLPAAQGGLGVDSVYIDTVGSFSYCGAARAANRLCVPHLGGAAEAERSSRPTTPLATSLLEGIHVFRVYAAHELVALLCSFDEIASRIAGIGLVVVNTVSWPFLASFASSVARRQAMHAELARVLSLIASKHKVAVVLVSQAKSAFGRSSMPSSSMDGDVWARVSANRLSLQRRASGDVIVALSASTMHSTGETLITNV